MKICSPQLGMDPNSTLGGEVHDHFVLQNLARLGEKIYVYLPKKRDYQKHRNLTVQYAPIKHIPAFLFNIIEIPYLFKIYKKEKFQILRVHSPYFVGLGSLFFKLFNKQVPVVATYHLIENGFVFNLINRLTAQKYDAIFTVSKFVKNWLVKNYGVEADKVQVVYNGVNPSLKPQAKSLSLLKKFNLQDKFVILFMGVLIERKNPMFLLEIYKQLKSKHREVALIICGKGHLKSKLEKFTKENNLSDVIFANEAYGEEKLELFNLCDVFALPSKNEGFGLVVAEAMACRKAVIVADNSSLREIVKAGEDGILAKTDNTNDWTQKLEELLTNKRLREKLGANAYRKAKNLFNWGNAVHAHQKLFEKLTNA